MFIRLETNGKLYINKLSTFRWLGLDYDDEAPNVVENLSTFLTNTVDDKTCEELTILKKLNSLDFGDVKSGYQFKIDYIGRPSERKANISYATDITSIAPDTTVSIADYMDLYSLSNLGLETHLNLPPDSTKQEIDEVFIEVMPKLADINFNLTNHPLIEKDDNGFLYINTNIITKLLVHYNKITGEKFTFKIPLKLKKDVCLKYALGHWLLLNEKAGQMPSVKLNDVTDSIDRNPDDLVISLDDYERKLNIAYKQYSKPAMIELILFVCDQNKRASTDS